VLVKVNGLDDGKRERERKNDLTHNIVEPLIPIPR
jgi:hypothetical protein